jgi:thiol-disulfide isomerase/thioredoxin
MKYHLSIFLCLIFLNLSAQKKKSGQFILTGNIVGQNEGYVYLNYADKNDQAIRDSCRITNGKFQFKGFIKEPTVAGFNGKLTSRSVDDPNFTSIFLEPGNMQVKVIVNQFKLLKLTGSVSQSDFELLQKQKHKVSDRWKTVMDTLSAVNKRSNFQYQELKDWVLTPYNAEMRQIDFDFYDKHPGSYATAYYLRFDVRNLTTDSLKMFYDRFPEKLKQSSYGKTIATELGKRKIGIPGTLANDFVSSDVNGQRISLADYKGKYVLLDFWASWCLPCRKESPHLKELYAKYNPKGFEVIGVASDDGHEDKWKDAITQDQVGTWKHILNGFDRGKNKKGIGDSFNISELPTQILIDPNGMIIGRYSEGAAEMEALDKKLKEIFKTE